MAVKIELTKTFSGKAESKNTNDDPGFNADFQNMVNDGDIISFEINDIDDTTRREVMIFKDVLAYEKFKTLFSEGNTNLESLVVNSIDREYQV